MQKDYKKEDIKSKAVTKKIQSKTLPHNLEAEQSLLGCILIDGIIAGEVIGTLFSDDFYTETHKNIFDGMKNIFVKNLPVDFVTLTDELDRNGLMEAVGGIGYITALTSAVPSAANFKQYYDIIKRDGAMRRLIFSGQKIIENAYEADDRDRAVAYAEKLIYDVNQNDGSNALSSINASLTEVITRLDNIHKNKDAYKGLFTGFSGLDYLLNGLQKGDLVLIAARPGMGKTSLAMNIIENAAIFSAAKCAIFSLEMPRMQLAQRLLCAVANVSMTDAVKGKLKLEQWSELIKANNLIAKADIYVDDSSLITPAEILSKCRRLKTKSGLDLIMVDYIQLMSSGNKKVENRQQEISEISRNLKIIAKELNVPVIALSQLSRAVEARTSHRPQLSDLRESGAIEQDADVVIFIHRPDLADDAATAKLKGLVSDSQAELIIAKHRNGPMGTVTLNWKGETVKFSNPDKYTEDIMRQYQQNAERKKNRKEQDGRLPDINEVFNAPPAPPDVAPSNDAPSEPPDIAPPSDAPPDVATNNETAGTVTKTAHPKKGKA